MRTTDWVDGKIVILDQTALPHEKRFLTVATVAELVVEIRRLAVRGAMALGVAGAMGMALAACRAAERGEDVAAALVEAAEVLRKARPTAVNLAAGVDQVLAVREVGAPGIVAAALAIRDADIRSGRAIGTSGAAWLAGARRLLTHCNAGALAGVESGTALSIVESLDSSAQLDIVYVCETRPLLQGSRLTAWELVEAGISHKIVVDGAAAGLIVGGRVDAVVVGADRIAANGDVVNKVGTLGHALAAHRAGIPFVVAAPEATIDLDCAVGADVPIEERDGREVLEMAGQRVAAAGSAAFNPAFDVTPADLVSVIITEERTIVPSTDRVGRT